MGVVQCMGQPFGMQAVGLLQCSVGCVGCSPLVTVCVLMVEGSLLCDFEHAHKVKL